MSAPVYEQGVTRTRTGSRVHWTRSSTSTWDAQYVRIELDRDHEWADRVDTLKVFPVGAILRLSPPGLLFQRERPSARNPAGLSLLNVPVDAAEETALTHARVGLAPGQDVSLWVVELVALPWLKPL